MSAPPQNERLLSRRRAMALLGATAAVPLVACKPAASPPAAASGGTAAKDGGLHFLTLAEVARRIAARELSPVDLTQRLLDRIHTIDPTLTSFATVMSEQALADARAATREIEAGRYRGPLHGVPLAVKDLCYTKGVRTMGGSAVLKDFVPDFDGTVVSRLRDAGAVLLGKLNLTEGACAGYSPAMGVPRNPWNTDYWPGLSSSGSGVALAAGLCYGAIGTDTGGSIRFPSSADGVVGLKPTYGRVSRWGVLTFADSLDHVGPMARSVTDVAIMLDAIAGKDPNDPTSLDAPPPNATREVGRDIRDLKIGIDRQYALEGVDKGDAAALEQALKVLAGLGAQIVDVRMPDLSSLLPTWQTIAAAELAEAHREHYPSRASEYGPYIREFLENGVRVTPEQLDRPDRRAWRSTRNSSASRVGGCDGVPRGRRAGVANHARDAGRSARRVPRRVVRCRTASDGFHRTDGSRRHPRHLSPVGLLARRLAVQRPIRRPQLERASAVPHRGRIRARHELAWAISSPDRMTDVPACWSRRKRSVVWFASFLRRSRTARCES